MPHLICQAWTLLHITCHASYCALHYLVLICALLFLYVCLLLPSRHRHRAVRAGVRAHPSGGSRLYHYRWADRRALSLHLLYILLSLLLLSFGCDSFESRVLFHLLPYTSRVSLPLPITVVFLFASLASHSACLGLVVYLDLLSGYVGVYHMFHRILC